jgi:predicted amidophosphoribosyltransferase
MHRGLAKRLVHRFKYEGHSALGRQMGQALARNITLPADVDVIVPVPLHKKSDRPYNQALELARGISEIWEIPVGNVLQWAMEGKRQVEKTARERKELPLNALVFSGSPGDLCGKKALLVDDVSTTGTTLKRSAEVLHRTGVKVPGAVVWTRVPDKE